MSPAPSGSNDQSLAAERWLRTAPGPAREDSPELPRERRSDGMSDQEDAEVHSVEPTAGKATGNCSSAEARGEELRARDEPTLRSGDLRERFVDPGRRVQNVVRVGR